MKTCKFRIQIKYALQYSFKIKEWQHKQCGVTPHFCNIFIDFEVYRKKYIEKRWILTQLIEKRFLIDLLTTNNVIYHELLILNFPYLTIHNQPLKGVLGKQCSWDSKLSVKKNHFKSRKFLWEIPRKDTIIKLCFKFLACNFTKKQTPSHNFSSILHKF